MKAKTKLRLLAIVLLLAGFWIWKAFKSNNTQRSVIEEVHVSRGDIEILVTTTGTVQPQNRLEMKPPINGRIEEILVREGEHVPKGKVVAWMSSTERAALLDTARTKDEETLQYWQEAYKPTPLIAPIEGDVIVRAVEPGQTVTSSDAVIVLSDRLIVKAQVDETDIGRVRIGLNAIVSLDAYPREKINAKVDHISYESKLVNNVTIYEVDILTEEIPDMFRSGMTANVSIAEKSRENVLRIPVDAIHREKGGTFVRIKGQSKPEKVETGLSDESYVEILSGLSEEETIVVEKRAATLPKKNSTGNNPFMPSRQQNR